MTFDELYESVKPAVKSVSGRYAKYGFTPEDCQQEAAVIILGVIASEAGGSAAVSDYRGYVKRCVMNHLAGIPRRFDSHCQDDGSAPEPAEAKRTDPLDWHDLLSAAPPNVRTYIQAKVIDELSWADTRELFDVSDRGLAAIRSDAAHWLLHQLEGRKTK